MGIGKVSAPSFNEGTLDLSEYNLGTIPSFSEISMVSGGRVGAHGSIRSVPDG